MAIRSGDMRGARTLLRQQKFPCSVSARERRRRGGNAVRGFSYGGRQSPLRFCYSLFVCARSTISCAIRWISAFIRWMQSISRHWPFTMSSAKVSQVGDPQEPQS